MTVQIRNPEATEILRPDVQHKYEPNFALPMTISTILGLSGLRSFWPMSSNSVSGGGACAVLDISGAGAGLANVGQAQYAMYGIQPYMRLDGTNDYLWAADANHFDIIGNEAYIETTYQGLTIGGWFYFVDFASVSNDGVIGKYLTTGNQRSYLIYTNTPTSNTVNFLMSTDGIALTIVAGTTVLSAGEWYFIVGRFDPSTELALFVDRDKDTNAVGIPATIFNSTAQFNIGDFNNGGGFRPNMACSMCFLTATALPDVVINNIYEQSKALFAKE